MKTKKFLSVLLMVAMLASVFTGCSNNSTTGTTEGAGTTAGTEASGTTEAPGTEATTEGTTESGEKVWDFMSGDPVTLTVYPTSANAKAGLVTGTIADWLLENYNIRLEIWPYSAEKTVSILTSGDLPDIMYFNSVTDVESAIMANNLVNLDEYVEEMPHVSGNEALQPVLKYIREFRSADTDKVYCLPLNVGYANDTGIDTGAYGLKIHWDTYSKIGCPEIKTLEDLTQVFKDMQAARPVAEDGTKVYALRLFYGYAKDCEATTTGFYSLYGYDTASLPYLIETDMVNATYKSILDDDSLYKRGVKWYNTMMREGLIDPDSISTDRKTAQNNTKAGYGLAGIQTATTYPAHGFYYAYLNDMDIYYNTNSTFGLTKSIGIGANTKNLEAALCFIDLLSDIDFVMQFTEGPKGELFEVVDGKAVITDAYKDWLVNSGGNKFKYKNGEEAIALNIGGIMNVGNETSWGTKGKVAVWPEATALTNQNLATLNQWKTDMKYDSWTALLEDNDALHKTSELTDVVNFTTSPDDDMALLISALQTTVIDYTWKLYYAESDAQFDALWKEMVDTCKGLEAEKVIQWRLDDLAAAKEIKNELMK